MRSILVAIAITTMFFGLACSGRGAEGAQNPATCADSIRENPCHDWGGGDIECLCTALSPCFCLSSDPLAVCSLMTCRANDPCAEGRHLGGLNYHCGDDP